MKHHIQTSYTSAYTRKGTNQIHLSSHNISSKPNCFATYHRRNMLCNRITQTLKKKTYNIKEPSAQKSLAIQSPSSFRLRRHHCSHFPASSSPLCHRRSPYTPPIEMRISVPFSIMVAFFRPSSDVHSMFAFIRKSLSRTLCSIRSRVRYDGVAFA